MFHTTGASEIILRTSLVYLFLLLGLRLAGKREMGQMTVFDLVVVLVIANAVQNAMVGQDTSLTGGLVAAATLLTLNYAVSWLRYRSRSFARWIGGVPTVIVQEGRFLEANLRKENLGEDEVLMAMREHGIDRLDQVRRAVLETDGSISLVTRADAHVKARRHVRFLKKG